MVVGARIRWRVQGAEVVRRASFRQAVRRGRGRGRVERANSPRIPARRAGFWRKCESSQKASL